MDLVQVDCVTASDCVSAATKTRKSHSSQRRSRLKLSPAAVARISRTRCAPSVSLILSPIQAPVLQLARKPYSVYQFSMAFKERSSDDDLPSLPPHWQGRYRTAYRETRIKPVTDAPVPLDHKLFGDLFRVTDGVRQMRLDPGSLKGLYS